jgi:phosphopentomutase
MFKRVCIIVLDSVGIGALPDAAEYGDENAHTLGNIFAARGRLEIPNLLQMRKSHAQKTPQAVIGK